MRLLHRGFHNNYYTGDFTRPILCQQADEQLFRVLKYNPSIIFYHLSAAHHTPPIPMYVIMSYPPKAAVLTSADVASCSLF